MEENKVMTMIEAVERLYKAGRTLEEAKAEVEKAEKDGLPLDLYVELMEKDARERGETRVYELNAEGHMIDRIIP